MPAFFLALIATFLAATGGRDQLQVTSLSGKFGANAGLLASAWIAAAATSAFAAAVGAVIAQLLPSAGKTMFVAFALLLGAIELAWPIRRKEPEEPTRSLAAALFVLASLEIGDGARFLVVALAAATGAPVLAGLGGAIGGGAALSLGWALGGEFGTRFPLRSVRLAIAAALLAAAVWAALIARGVV